MENESYVLKKIIATTVFVVVIGLVVLGHYHEAQERLLPAKPVKVLLEKGDTKYPCECVGVLYLGYLEDQGGKVFQVQAYDYCLAGSGRQAPLLLREGEVYSGHGWKEEDERLQNYKIEVKGGEVWLYYKKPPK